MLQVILTYCTAHRMCVGFGHCHQVTRPLGLAGTDLILTSIYQSSEMSPFSPDVFPGVHGRAAKLSCFLFCFGAIWLQIGLSFIIRYYLDGTTCMRCLSMCCLRVFVSLGARK
jgi:hypothetical protein